MRNLPRPFPSSPVPQAGHNNHPVIVGLVFDESPCPQRALPGDVISASACLIPWLTSPTNASVFSFSALLPEAWHVLENKVVELSCQKLPEQVNWDP